MKLTRDYDVAVICSNWGVSIYLARIPDPDIVAFIYSLEENAGITLPEDSQSDRPFISSESSIKKPERHRLYYFLQLSPTFKAESVGRQIAHALKDVHGLTVRLIFDIPEDNSFDKATILKPSR